MIWIKNERKKNVIKSITDRCLPKWIKYENKRFNHFYSLFCSCIMQSNNIYIFAQNQLNYSKNLSLSNNWISIAKFAWILKKVKHQLRKRCQLNKTLYIYFCVRIYNLSYILRRMIISLYSYGISLWVDLCKRLHSSLHIVQTFFLINSSSLTLFIKMTLNHWTGFILSLKLGLRQKLS